MRNTRMKFTAAILLTLGGSLLSLVSLGQHTFSYGGDSNPCAGPNAPIVTYYAIDPSNTSSFSAEFDMPGIEGPNNDYIVISRSSTDKKVQWLREISGRIQISASGYANEFIDVTTRYNGAPGISISADRNNICEATSPITFSAFVTNGTGAILKWYRNGTLAQTGGATFSQAFQNNDHVYATATSNNGCGSGATGTSNTVTLTLKPKYAVDLNLPGPQEVCSCGAVDVGASPTSSGTITSYSYDWYVDGNHQYQDMLVETCGPDRKVYLILPSGPGSSTSMLARPYASKQQGVNSTYTVQADVRYTQDNGCVYDISEQATVTVTPPPTFTVGITTSPSRQPAVYCEDEVTLHANANFGATFLWYKGHNGIWQGVGQGADYHPQNFAPGDQIRVDATATTSGCIANTTASFPLPEEIKINQPVGAVTIKSVEGDVHERCQKGGSTTFFGEVVGGNATSFTWSITGGGTSHFADPSDGTLTWDENFAGQATLHVVAHGCLNSTSSGDYPVTVYAAPTIQPVSLNFCDFQSILLTVPEKDKYTLKWYDANQNVLGEAQQQEAGEKKPGTFQYFVTGVDERGCGSSLKTSVSVTVRSDCDDNLNWIETKGFDETGTKIADSRTYFDYVGTAMQQQAYNMAVGKILASQPIRDGLNRPSVSTLSAPLDVTAFQYQHRFVTNANGDPYREADFGQALNSGASGTLNRYYSAPVTPTTPKSYVPVSGFPFTQVEYYKDGTGERKYSANTGEVFHQNNNHKVLTATTPIYQALDNYLTKRAYIFNATPNFVQPATLAREGVQAIARDENGLYSMSFSDKDGHTLMTAQPAASATEAWLEVNNSVNASSDEQAENFSPITYFFVTEPQTIGLTGTGVYTVEDLVCETTVNATQPLNPGLYRIVLTSGEVTLTYKQWLKNIACNFYDNAGRLVVSVSPNGYQQWKADTDYASIDKTTYTYNFKGWLTEMTEIDAGRTSFKYRRDGNIRFSQSAQQFADETANRAGKGRFSYTLYDENNRPSESGEYIGTQYTFAALNGQLEFTQQVTYGTDRKDWIKTTYDYADGAIPYLPSTYKQQFVRGAVSTTENANNKTWYSYDDQGRLSWMAQKPAGLNRVFLTEYTYDFLGDVLVVANASYDGQDHKVEPFYHHYEYDTDKRLISSSTSLDGSDKKLRASYFYYLHGPLKRIELGEKLQGIDFVYNIHGWLTQINHPDESQDPNLDGNDVFGMVLDYYESDMAGIFQTSANLRETNDPNRFHRLPVESPRLESSWTYQPKPAYQQEMAGNLARIKALKSEEEMHPSPPATLDHFKEIAQVDVFTTLPERPAEFEPNPSKNDRVVSASAVRALYEAPAPFDVVPDDIEFSVLKNFYDSLQGTGWYTKTNWPTTWPATATSAQFGTWFGITVTNGDVTGIYFGSNNNLKGLLPKSIFKLTQLTTFQLYNNTNITGTIPTSMGSLSKLTRLEVSGSQLSGAIPASLGNLSNLSVLRFDYNKLSGSLPAELGNITTLTAIVLQQNTITGSIPASFNNLTNMVGINISLNKLTGSIPDLGNLRNLTLLNLGGNTLSGSLPSTLCNLTALKTLWLNNNLLSGTLPAELGNLTQLETLYLHSNTFTGSIPVSLGKLTKLTSLFLSTNKLTGSVPESLSNLTEMVTFGVSQNTLSGEFPAAILSKWTKLTSLQLFTNAFTGSFPASIGSCPALTTLTASTNKFTDLPQTLLSLPLLATLEFQSNNLTTIPNLANHPNKSKLTVKLRDNLLDFTTWEPIFGATGAHGIKSLDYASQKVFPSNKIYVTEQNRLTINATSRGQNGSVVWEQKSGATWTNVNSLNEDATSQTFTVSNATTSTYGTYRWTMTDVKVPSLTLQSGEFEVLSIDAPTVSSGLYNGLISSVSWRTDEAYLSGEEGFKGVYRYQYDDKYQIKDSRWGTPNSNWDGFADGANTFRVTGLNYDPNGNILALKRYNEDGSLTNDFQYAYDGKKNQLKSVTGYRNNYQYNANGQMIAEDKVSGPDQYVDYDVTGKVRKVYFDAAWTVPNVEYLYDDHGFRMAKIDYQSKKTTWYVRDVTGNVVSVYEQTGSLPDAPKPVQWTTLTGIVENQGDLSLVSGTTSGTGYGNRLEAYQNGYMEYTVSDINQPKDIGLVSSTTYCFNFYDQFGLAPVRANGRAYDAPNYTIGTKFKIEKLNDKITFYKDGAVLRQFAINPAEAFTLYVILRQTTKILGKNLKFVVTSTPTAPTLRQVEVPIYGAGKLGTYYPDQDGSTAYEITDHLGNVRALLRENVNTYTATMEDNGLNDTSNPRYQESGYFENLFETEMDDARMNHTANDATTVSSPSMSAYLYWKEGVSGLEASDKAVGPAMGLKVKPGDRVTMETWVRYEAKTENNTRDMTMAMLAQTLGAALSYQAGFEGLPLNKTTSILSTGLGAGGFFNSSVEDDQPFAYLNYILFDENNEFVDAGWQQVPVSAAFEPGHEGIPNNRSHARLTFDHPIEITKAGSIYIWVSNESEDTKVWFDDLKVTHEAAFVIKAVDYGTWGDVIREQEVAEYKYRFGYQGQFAEKDEETGWNHFETRNYDPVIGRWLTPDPAREFWSRYLGMGNNPILFIDPDGETIIVGEYIYVPGQDYTGKNPFIAATVKSLNRLYKAEQNLGKSIIGALSQPDVELKILKSSMKTMGYRGDGTLGYNLFSGLSVYDGDPKKDGKVIGTQSPEIGLIHEIAHAYDDLINKSWYDHVNDKSTRPDFDNMAEKIAVDIENEFIKQMNLMFDLDNMMRSNDYGVPFKTDSPESNKPEYNTKGDRVH